MFEQRGQRVGIVLVDHGSKRQEANAMMYEVAAMFTRVSGAAIVEPAHMELAEPTIEQAFRACVARGATLVIVHPYFLSPGRHSTADIPRLAEEAARQHPGVRYQVTPPLGLDDRIGEVVLQRIQDCLDSDSTAGVSEETATARR
ncbi:MAG: cobalamin biosynthesis protein CbiX [Chloroflexi bacterium]|nr:cobalamin biosynthesis protein CbiX [Chloroflexota bacterium]